MIINFIVSEMHFIDSEFIIDAAKATKNNSISSAYYILITQ